MPQMSSASSTQLQALLTLHSSQQSFLNDNKYSVEEINSNDYLKNKIKLIGDNKSFPKKIKDSSGNFTSKFLKWNQQQIKKGTTFFYAGGDKIYNPATKRFINKKLDKRFNKKVYKKEKNSKNIVNNVNFNNIKKIVSKDNYFMKTKIGLEKVFSKEKSEILVDLKKIQFSDVLDLIEETKTSGVKLISSVLDAPNTWITFSSVNIQRLRTFSDLKSVENGSDISFLMNALSNEGIIILRNSEYGEDGNQLEFIGNGYEKPSGAFFKYYNRTSIDLSKYDIYQREQIYTTDEDGKNKFIEYNDNCLLVALRNSGVVSDSKLNSVKELFKNSLISTCKLNIICKTINITISLNRLINGKSHTLKYGNGKETIKIALLDEHYFLNDETEFTRYSLEHYEEIKHLQDFNKIYKMDTNGKYKKSNDRFIKSMDVVKILLNNENLIEKIPIKDLMDTQYFNNEVDDNALEYDDSIYDLKKNPSGNLKENEISKVDNIDFRVFYDFETDTSNGNHKPYLMNYITSEDEQGGFYGEDSGTNFINFLKKLGKRRSVNFEKNDDNVIMLIAHNQKYDFTFIFEKIFCLDPLLKGNRLMGGSGRLYYGTGEYVVVKFQDSLNLIPESLSKFGKMFNLDQKKELLPYDMYNSKNIEKRFLKVGKCLDFVDEEEHGIFLDNCKKFNAITKKKKLLDTIEETREQTGKETYKLSGGYVRIIPDEDYDDEGFEFEEQIINKGRCEDMNGNISLKNFGKYKRIKYISEEVEVIDILKYSYEYCRIDCEVLKKGYDTFREQMLKVAGLDIINYCSLASLANDFFIKEGCFDGCYALSGVPRNFIQKCVVGGRVMCANNEKQYFNPNGEKNEKDYQADYDFTSLYPSSMERIKGYLKGSPKVLQDKTREFLFNENLCSGFFVKVLCLNNPTINRDFPVLSVLRDGIRNFTNETEGETFYIDKITFEDAEKFQGLQFKILGGYYYNEGHNNKINEVIRYCFNERLKYKKEKNPIEKIYKLLMNSSYGKTMLKPIDSDIQVIHKKKWGDFIKRQYNFIKEFTKSGDLYIVKLTKSIGNHFNNVYAGVEILSMSKRIVNELMYVAQDNNIFISYTDTDSIHLRYNEVSKLEKVYKEKYGRVITGKDLGQAHIDFDLNYEVDGVDKWGYTNKKSCSEIKAVSSIFLGKKCYIDKLEGKKDDGSIHTDYHIRMKGIPEKSIIYTCKKLGLEPVDLYNKLLEGDKIGFDLLCGGKRCNFKYDKDFSVKSLGYYKINDEGEKIKCLYNDKDYDAGIINSEFKRVLSFGNESE